MTTEPKNNTPTDAAPTSDAFETAFAELEDAIADLDESAPPQAPDEPRRPGLLASFLAACFTRH